MPRILVGGDNETMLHLHDRMREHLSPSGCSVVYCATPGEIVSRLRDGAAHLLLLFFESAPLATIDTCRLIRKVPGGEKLPILVWGEDVDAWDMKNVHALPTNAAQEIVVRQAAALLGLDDVVRAFDEEQGAAQEETAEENPAETIHETRLRSLNIRTRTDMPALPTTHMISDSFRQKWFYESNTVQGFLDWIEDLPLFQRICDWRYGKLAGGKPENTGSESSAAESASVGGVTVTSIATATQVDSRNVVRKTGKMRGLIILAVIVVLCILGVYGMQYLEKTEPVPAAVPQGALTHIVCVSCGFEQTRQVRNINRVCCPKCRARMGFAYQCGKCGKVFVHEANNRRVKTLKDVSLPPACPNCMSKKTRPYLPPPTSLGK